jgi:hypothetical protein
LTNWAVFSQILLLIGLVWSFISLWQSAKKTSKKNKILNIVDEHPSRNSVDISNKPKRNLNHLFDELDE